MGSHRLTSHQTSHLASPSSSASPARRSSLSSSSWSSASPTPPPPPSSDLLVVELEEDSMEELMEDSMVGEEGSMEESKALENSPNPFSGKNIVNTVFYSLNKVFISK